MDFRLIPSITAIISIATLAGCLSQPPRPDDRAEGTTKVTPTALNGTKQPVPTPPVAAEPVELLELSRRHFALDLTQSNPAIDAQLEWYRKHPEYVTRVLERAGRYYYHVLHETLQRGMPAELALLPVIESAYDPFAYSHGQAAGPWQFIPSTGKYFGLKQSWWYDGRRDVIASTDAALNYLQRLYQRFDSWELALAGYNAGGGNVSKAIRRNREAGKATDFWSLDLPSETEAYVPKLIALAKLIQQADHYGVTLPEIPNEPYFEMVETGSQIDLAQAAALAGTTTQELYLLNPGFNHWATDPQGPHQLLVPKAQANQFRAALESLPASQRVKWARHKVTAGESLISIARLYRTTVDVIKTANDLDSNAIRAGQALMIPTASQRSTEYVLSEAQRLNRKQEQIARTTQRHKLHHTVGNGDSFWSIAKQHKVGVRQLASWNNMAPGDTLSVGKKLVIWKDPAATTLSSSERAVIRKVGYKVRSGDSLATIANRFRVSVKNILHWNNLDVKQHLQPGQHLTLYVDVTRAR
jgi:membrane-bound lytic murein transglycosylase D